MVEISSVNNNKWQNQAMAATITISSSSTIHHHVTLVEAMFPSKSSNTTICNTLSSNKCNLHSNTEEAISLRIIQLSGRELHLVTIQVQKLKKAQSRFITHLVVDQISNCSDMYKSRVIDRV